MDRPSSRRGRHPLVPLLVVATLPLVAPLAADGPAAVGFGTLSGRVLPAFKLDAVTIEAPACGGAELRPLAADRLAIAVEPCRSTTRVVVALRTNADGWRLRWEPAVPGVQVRGGVGAVVAAGTGALVSPSAVARTILRKDDLVLAEGGRISLRGSFSSPNNALLVPLSFHPAPEDGRIAGSLVLEPNPCGIL